MDIIGKSFPHYCTIEWYNISYVAPNLCSPDIKRRLCSFALLHTSVVCRRQLYRLLLLVMGCQISKETPPQKASFFPDEWFKSNVTPEQQAITTENAEIEIDLTGQLEKQLENDPSSQMLQDALEVARQLEQAQMKVVECMKYDKDLKNSLECLRGSLLVQAASMESSINLLRRHMGYQVATTRRNFLLTLSDLIKPVRHTCKDEWPRLVATGLKEGDFVPRKLLKDVLDKNNFIPT